MSLSSGQLTAIEITERVSSVLSLLGTSFIIVTFLSDKAFRKPINRLVFYAAWGNVAANVATLIGVSGVHLGAAAPLCQFQAFVIQMFMPADALWTFAMACNVYLTFFREYDAAKLRTLELRYLLFCYGLPFIPAIVYCFVQTASKGKIYGPAVLWCWVSLEWDALRIATFYGPVWIVIIATFSIYVCAGIVVFKWRDQLIHMARSENLSRTTHHEENRELGPVEAPTRMKVHRDEHGVWITQPDHSYDERAQEKLQAPLSPNTGLHVPLSPNIGLEVPLSPISGHPDAQRSYSVASRDMPTTDQANQAAINYCKCAMLFFVALLVTWVPSTINRVYTLVYPHSFIFGLDYASGLVLPLQGFWNSVVYIVISFSACKDVCSKLRHRISRQRRDGDTVGKPRGCLSLRTESTENLTDT